MGKANGSISDPDVLQSTDTYLPDLNEKTLANLPGSIVEVSQERRAADPFLGRIIASHYRIESRVGEGGMCAVYRATDLTLNRSVAIKVLLPGRLVEEGLLRFQREAKTVGALDHPNIMRIYELNTTEDGDPFMVMEFLDGKNLAEILKQSDGINFETAVELVRQCANALACAHAKGFVHRDVKPGNIIVVKSPAGEDVVKLVDFGIAHIADPATMQLTRTGDVFGSPYYMSPEQCRGEKVDNRSDVYSLGCVLYECLAKRVPFLGSSALDTLRLHTDETPVPPSKVNRNLRLGAEADRLTLKCLAKDPEHRYQTADEVAKGLLLLLSRDKSSFGAIGANILRSIPLPNLNNRSLNKKLVVFYSICLLVSVVCVGVSRGQFWFDKIWNDTEVKGQQAFDQGNFNLAKSELERSLEMARYLPVSKKDSKIIATVRDLKDLAWVMRDSDSLAKWRKASKEQYAKSTEKVVREEYSEQRNQILESVKRLESLQKPEVGESRDAAEQIINQACDLAISFQTVHQRSIGYFFLRDVFEKTSKYVPESSSAFRRVCYDLAVFASAADQDSFAFWMSKARKSVELHEGVSEQERAKILSDFAMAYNNVGNKEEAIKCIDAAIQALRLSAVSRSDIAAEVFMRKALFDQMIGNEDSSAFYMSRAKGLLKNAPPGTYRAQQLLSLQIWTACRGVPSEAVLKDCLAWLQQMESAHDRAEYFAMSLFRVGELSGRLGHLEMCSALCSRSALIGHEHGSRFDSFPFAAIGHAFATHGKINEGIPYMVRALKALSPKSGETNSYVANSMNLAAAYTKQGKVRTAFQLLKDSESRIEPGQRLPKNLRMQLYRALSRLAESAGDHQSAALYHQKWFEIGQN